MADQSTSQLLSKLRELEVRLEESEHLIEAIKAGEVDAFAINNNSESQVFTLESGDYAYRVLIEEFGEGAINVTEEGLIVYTNECFCELLGIPYENTIGRLIYDFIEEGSSTEFRELFEKSLTGKSKGEICLKGHDKEIPVYISMTSLQPKLPTVGIIITDLTEKKKNEKIILAYQKDLETKNQELVKSNTELASFAYIASHDLQEPLRKIQMFANRILEKEHGFLTEIGKDHFSRMQAAAKRMQTLIEDLLSYSRTNTMQRIFVTTSLNDIVEEVKDDLHDELGQKKAVLLYDNLGEAKIIPFQFRQLLNNLISNSLKFATPDIPPVIQIRSAFGTGSHFRIPVLHKDKNYCHISVTDNGIGFEPQYNEKIFELFQRLHDKSQYTGTGIGLAIVKKIVENHNGFITATSELGKGSTFDIYIPV
jgi:PAS domain S-box-containing protein